MGMQYSSGLVAGYPFENSGADVMGTNNATMIGTTFIDDTIGKVANLDGVDDIINYGDADIFSFTDGVNDKPFTISLWLYLDRTSNQLILGKRGSNGIEYQVSFISQKIGIYAYSENSSAKFIGAELQTNFPQTSWHHIAITYDGSGDRNGFEIYLDCVKKTLNRYSGGVYVKMTNTNQILTSGTNTFGVFLKGRLKHVKIRNKVLQQSEIQRDYLNLPIF